MAVMFVVDSYSINGVYPLLFYIAFLFIYTLFSDEILREDLEHGTWTPDVSLEPGLQQQAFRRGSDTTHMYCELYCIMFTFMLSIKVA